MQVEANKFIDVPTQELIDEIAKRSNLMVFYQLYPGEAGELNMRYWFKGDEDLCVGLCHALVEKIKKHSNKDR